MSSRVVSFAALSVCAALATGCGSSSSGSSTSASTSSSTPAGSAQQFNAQADQICAGVNGQILAAPAPHSASEVIAFFQKFLPIEATAEAQLKALAAPSSQQPAVNTWIADLEKKAAIAQQALAALQAGNVAQYKSLVQQTDTIDTRAEASALGLTECAKNPVPGGGSGASGATSTSGATTSNSGGASPGSSGSSSGTTSPSGGASPSNTDTSGSATGQQNGGASPSQGGSTQGGSTQGSTQGGSTQGP